MQPQSSRDVHTSAAASSYPLALVADAHERCREQLAARLSESPTPLRARAISPHASTITAALRLERRAVLVLSCCDGSLHPLALLADLRREMPTARVVVLTRPDGFSFEHCAGRLKPDVVVHSLAEVGLAVQTLVGIAPERPAWFGRPRPLTPRETEIVQHVATGLRNAQIAQTIGIAEKTVKVNLTNIYGKLGIHGRLELTALAPRLLSPHTPRRAAGI